LRLVALCNICELDLLRHIYGRITTTPEVAFEFGESPPDWVEIKSPINKSLQQILELQLDKGEASAIALAIKSMNAHLYLMT